MTPSLPARLALVALFVAAPAAANIGGIVGFADIGCSDCHVAEGAVAPLIAIVGPTSVPADSEVTYQVVVTSQGPTQTAAGFNFAPEAGDVAVGAETGIRRAENRELRRFELTHIGPRQNDGEGRASFTVTWLTPATPGEYVLFAAGNSVNENNEPLGDASAFTVLTVTVGGVAPSPTPTATPLAGCAGDCNGDGGVAINELISGVNIALGSAAVETCAAVDADGDGSVAINELVGAVTRALNGC